MATYRSDQIANATPIAGYGSGGAIERIAHFRVDVPIGATTTDLFNLAYLPPDAMVTGGVFKFDALGAGTFSIGDTGGGVSPTTGTAITASANRYFTAVAVTSSGNSTAMNNTGRYFKNGKVKTLIQGVFAAGTTTTAGAIEGHITYLVEEPQ